MRLLLRNVRKEGRLFNWKICHGDEITGVVGDESRHRQQKRQKAKNHRASRLPARLVRQIQKPTVGQSLHGSASGPEVHGSAESRTLRGRGRVSRPGRGLHQRRQYVLHVGVYGGYCTANWWTPAR